MFSDARLTNLIANTLALLAVVAMIAGAIVWLAQRPYFSIAKIQIAPMQTDTLNYVSPTSVRATIAGKITGNFFSVSLDDTRELIETVPWVRHARIRRVWPDSLSIQIEEQQPLALWNEDQMINTWGEAFAANQGELDDEANLPQLNGPESSERLVVQRYAEIARWFAPLNLRVQEVTLSPRYAWDVMLSDGIHLSLGRDPAADVADPHGRSGALPFAARIERFVQAWPTLTQRLDGRAISNADLRYSNGFAITLAPVSNTSTK
ncbi:FtsQ-type POTRA domain-containing protein [Candidimonas sp. SYP-B2681]|uniref:cell division protein FtsQ/DivIB n=1 Tax=Candidimonas sp. SYP-B2681 TaxID=2497686 RepID=UPI000F86B7C0|nr:cell division protein FtsQ/DivIB [Candidimonas sp. SYP-B2681]RTZ44761.1 FtsQ-type POTRA domain-containing protein [Candidimonas sp. SYP-B2681]